MTKLFLAVLLPFAGSPAAATGIAETIKFGAAEAWLSAFSAAPGTFKAPASAVRGAARSGEVEDGYPYPDPGQRCRKPLVHIDQWGRIYRDGALLGSSAKDFKTSCSGDVAWQDTSDRLRKNDDLLGTSVKQYAIAWNTGDIAWSDSWGRLYKNKHSFGNFKQYSQNGYTGQVVWTNSWDVLHRDSERLGSYPTKFLSALFTGDVAWLDSSESVYKNSKKLGSWAKTLAVNDYTGAVIWTNSQNDLFKDEKKLGSSVARYEVARYTGDVVWLDNHRNIYKNAEKLGSDVVEFQIAADGRLQWRDSSGRWHYQR